MFLDINSIKIKKPNGTYISLGNYNNADINNGEKPISLIVEAKYGYYKVWSSDSGRNLAGTQSGTLIGIFPKIIIQFRKLNKSELETIIPILDSSRQIVSYYDPFKKAQIEIETYTGDYEIDNKGIVSGDNRKNEAFSCSFISVRKRG